MGEKGATPYQTLGTHLKYLREQAKQSLAEVSGAVEIDEPVLERIEEGKERPSEDILVLLINYFGMHDQEALQVWEMAGYETELPKLRQHESGQQNGKSVVMLLAIDARTVYTDSFEVTANEAGVTMTFGQNGGNQSNPVAKVGMSLDQAERVSMALKTALFHAKSKGKLLPPSAGSDRKTD